MLNEKKISSSGSITIPSAVRRELGIQKGEKVKIETVNNGQILLTRIVGSCVMCEKNEHLIAYKGKYICSKCLNDINKIAVEKENE